MRFWDASAIIPLVVGEPSSSNVQTLLTEDPKLVVWWGTQVEVVSALARSLRQERLAADQVTIKLKEIREILDAAEIVEPTRSVSERAERLLFNHVLRAADALQLGAALVIVRERPQGFRFVALDERLRVAARREGFTVIP